MRRVHWVWVHDTASIQSDWPTSIFSSCLRNCTGNYCKTLYLLKTLTLAIALGHPLNKWLSPPTTNTSLRFPHSDMKVWMFLKKLGSNKDFIITRPDKGDDVVLLKQRDHVSKMKHLLQDFTKFTKIDEHWVNILSKYQEKASIFVDNLLKSGIISEDERKNLKTAGSRLGIMYGLPEGHKSGLPRRQIQSGENSYNFRIWKYLVELLKPFTVSSFSVKVSFTFVTEIRKLSNCNYSMKSFYLVSLLTNIPVCKTIETILDKALYRGFDRKKFKHLL